MIKHPKDKAERRFINQKKKKRKSSMRNITVSSSNVHAALDQFLHSMKLIDADEHVTAWSGFDSEVFITLEKVQQEENIN